MKTTDILNSNLATPALQPANKPLGLDAFSFQQIAALPADELPPWIRANGEALGSAIELHLIDSLSVGSDTHDWLNTLTYLVREGRPMLVELRQLGRMSALIYLLVKNRTSLTGKEFSHLQGLDLHPWPTRDDINVQLSIYEDSGQRIGGQLAGRIWLELIRRDFPGTPVDGAMAADFAADFSERRPDGVPVWAMGEKCLDHLPQDPYVAGKIVSGGFHHPFIIGDYFAPPPFPSCPSPFSAFFEKCSKSSPGMEAIEPGGQVEISHPISGPWV